MKRGHKESVSEMNEQMIQGSGHDVKQIESPLDARNLFHWLERSSSVS